MKYIFKSEMSLSRHKYWVCDQVRDNPVCSATETTCGIEILPEVGYLLQFQQTNTPVLTSSQSDLCLSCSLAAGTFYTNGTEIKFSRSYLPYYEFFKGYSFKIDGRFSFPQSHYSFKNCRRHLPCCSFHDLLAVLLGSS